MPSFFVTDRKKARAGGSKKRVISAKKGQKDGDDKEARLSKRKRMMAAAEISSDEEGSVGSGGMSAGSEDDYDDEHERNLRQAQQLLAKLHEEKKEDEDVGELLKEDAEIKAGTLQRHIADDAELRDNEEITHRGHRFTPLCVALSPCKRYVISSGKECSIVKFDIVAKQRVGVIKRTKTGGEKQHAHFGHIYAVAVSPDGKYIASGGHDSVLKIWDFTTLSHLKDFTGHRAPITSLVFQHKTNYLFSGSKDRSVKLFDLDQMGLVDTMFGHLDGIHSMAILQKQRVVTAGSQDRSCRMWKVEDESQLLFDGLKQCVSMDCVAMLNDDYFVSGSADGSLAVWSVWKKKPLTIRRTAHGMRTPADPRWIVSTAAVPYSDLVATGSDDGLLKLWKISKDYKNIFQVFEYSIPGFLNSIQFSIDGTLLVVAAGQEHRDGRWWVDKEARNQVVVLPVHYGVDPQEEGPERTQLIGMGDDEEEEDEEVQEDDE